MWFVVGVGTKSGSGRLITGSAMRAAFLSQVIKVDTRCLPALSYIYFIYCQDPGGASRGEVLK